MKLNTFEKLYIRQKIETLRQLQTDRAMFHNMFNLIIMWQSAK